MTKSAFFLIVLTAICNVGHAKETVVVAIANSLGSEKSFMTAQALLNAIARKMGVSIELISLPAKRITLMLRKGEIHADFSRIKEYQNDVATAIRVDEPILTLPYHAYSTTESISINGWNNLESYNIVGVRGFVFVENYLKNHKIYHVDSADTALKFLKAGRADIFIETSLVVSNIMSNPDLDLSGIYQLEPAIQHLNSYTFFSEKYAHHVEPFNRALLEIKADDTYNKILGYPDH